MPPQLDTRIPLQAGVGVRKPLDPFEARAEHLKLRDMARAEDLGQLDYERKKQDFADEQMTRQVLQESGGDLERALPRLPYQARLKVEPLLRARRKEELEISIQKNKLETDKLDKRIKSLDWTSRTAQRLVALIKQDPKHAMEDYKRAIVEGITDGHFGETPAEVEKTLTMLPKPNDTQIGDRLQEFVASLESHVAGGLTPQQFLQNERDDRKFKAELAQVEWERQEKGVKSDAEELTLVARLMQGVKNQDQYEAVLQSVRSGNVRRMFQPMWSPEVTQIATQMGRTPSEAETARHNVVGEAETRRHNLQAERNQDTAVTLSPEGLNISARLFATTGQMPPMGMGRAGAAVRQAIINRAGELFPQLNIAENRAAYDANKNSLTQLQKQYDAVTAFENTAIANTKPLLEVAHKIIDSGSPLINQPLRSLAGNVFGSVDMAKFDVLRQSVANEFSRIISNPQLTGVMSDSAREEGNNLLRPDMTLAQLVAAVETLEMEASNRRTMFGQQIEAIRGRLGAGVTPASGRRAAPKPGDVVGGYIFLGGDPNSRTSWRPAGIQ